MRRLVKAGLKAAAVVVAYEALRELLLPYEEKRVFGP